MTNRMVAKFSASALILAMCAGCSDPAATRQIILIEVGTGCQYVGIQANSLSQGRLNALLDASGKPVCMAAQ